jgi:ABC-type nitrate/sulfonate/bicarbonate transport system permease component
MRAFTGWGVALLLVGGWQVWTMSSQSIYFPTPLQILERVRERWFSGQAPAFLTPAFADDVVPSLVRLAIGLLIAWAVGISLGVLLGRIPVVAELIEPLLHFMRALPGPVLLPLALVLVGTGTSMRVGIIAFGAVWPVLFNTYSAVRQVPPGWIAAGRVARLGRTAMLLRVILPGSGAGIMAGVRVSTALGIILLIASELVAATNGIGFGLTQSQRSFQFADMWAFIVALSVLGYASNLLLAAVERVLLGWHQLLQAQH